MVSVLVAIGGVARADVFAAHLKIPGDGLITRLAIDGSDWLDAIETTDLSFSDITQGLSNTWTAEGWRHAKGSEIDTLLMSMSSVGCPGSSNISTGTKPTWSLVPVLIGSTDGTTAPASSLRALFDDGSESDGVGELIISISHPTPTFWTFSHTCLHDQVSSTEPDPTRGHLLVRASPAFGFQHPTAPPSATDGHDGDGWWDAQGFAVVNNNFCQPLSQGEQCFHLGEDWNSETCATCDLGEPVYASATGEVVYAGDHPDPDQLGAVMILHRAPDDEGFALSGGGSTMDVFTVYVHLQGILVSEGEIVRRGDQIATIGDLPGGPHLHLEVRTDTSCLPNCFPSPNYDPTLRDRVGPTVFFALNPPPACTNGTDDDADGTTDWDGGSMATAGQIAEVADQTCRDPWGSSEAKAPACGIGPDIAIVFALQAARLRRMCTRNS